MAIILNPKPLIYSLCISSANVVNVVVVIVPAVVHMHPYVFWLLQPKSEREGGRKGERGHLSTAVTPEKRQGERGKEEEKECV